MANAASDLGGAAKVLQRTLYSGLAFAAGKAMSLDAARMAARASIERAALGGVTNAEIFGGGVAGEGALLEIGGVIFQGAGTVVLGFMGGYLGAAAVICAVDSGHF